MGHWQDIKLKEHSAFHFLAFRTIPSFAHEYSMEVYSEHFIVIV